MKCPTEITVGHLRYKVVVDQAKVDRAGVEMRSDLAGFSNNGEQIIALGENHGPDYQAETLLHEVLHQCLRFADCDPDRDAKAGCTDLEERTVAAMSGPLLDTLRRNPDLVAYLLYAGPL